MYHYWALFGLKCHYWAYFAVIRMQILICDLHLILIGIYLTYRKTPVSGCKKPWFGLFCCNPDPDPDVLCRCRFWSGWNQIYLTYCNVPLLALICCKMALFGLFCCNLDFLYIFIYFWYGSIQIKICICIKNPDLDPDYTKIGQIMAF